jgi:glycosyltransferase involved in cell wall biosynthesis
MIVKNEERVLGRCLDSLQGIADEIIIVDTGSTDRTKEIARGFTDQVYDFVWCSDFAAARNYSFSLAHCDYIYVADADEMLDEKNRQAFLRLKDTLSPEVDIVQMNYLTPEQYNTVENYACDMRPKLYRRLRTFTWINPVHETVQLMPVVYDSEVEVLHLPEASHSKRDFGLFLSAIERDGTLAPETVTMYAKELLRCGSEKDFKDARAFFEELHNENITDESTCILARCARLEGDVDTFFSVALKNVAMGGCSEVMCELGDYYMERGNFDEASLWFYNAAFQVSPVLNIDTHELIPYQSLVRCYDEIIKQKSNQLSPGELEVLTAKREEYSERVSRWERPYENK